MKEKQPGYMINRAKAKIDKERSVIRERMVEKASKVTAMKSKELLKLLPKKRTAIMGMI